jgi:hypothetical protein
MERFINAVRKQWQKDDEKVVQLWNAGKTIDEIRAVVPISERTFFEILEVHASREAAGV